MLSVSTASVAQAIRPSIANASPSPPTLGRKERRSWNCEYTFPKRRCRPSSGARKKIIADGQEDATIEIDVHCKTVNLQQSELEIESSLDYFGERNSEPSSRESLESIANGHEEKAPRPIPFLKSAHMQRMKVSRPREEHLFDNVSEKPEKLLKISVPSITGEKDDSNDFPVTVVVERDAEKRDESEGIIDADRENFSRTGSNDTVETWSTTEESKISGFPVLGTRISRGVELLMRSAENIEYNVNEGTPGIPGDDIVRDAIENFPPIIEENGWDSEAEASMLQSLRDESISSSTERHEAHGFLEEEERSAVEDLPFYMIGFPNPPGENRCWLNATLHAIFALPLFDQPEQLESEQLRRCSQLTKTLLALRLFWSRGADHKHKTHQTVKLFKESLGILDESYPSQRQQDVSEFLTMFLNYLKTDFEKILSPRVAPGPRNFNGAENMTNNVQETRGTPRSPRTPTKRPPLADISPSKRKLFESGDCLGQLSPKSRKIGLTYSAQDLLSPRVNRILSKPSDPTYKVHTPPHRPPNSAGGLDRTKDHADLPKNPIDRYFLLHMMEHYSCKGCSKHRQRKVDNLMLYVDLPPGSEDRTVSLDEAIKTSLEPEERILTCGKCKYDKHKVFTSFRVCPKILMVQVNRYGMCEDGSVAKFNTPVEIPENLLLELGSTDEEKACGLKENFEPVCVIAHVGSAMDCGHYTSYVRHGDDCWYHYNDLMVTPMSRYEALAAAQTTAYVVFFLSSKV